MRYALSRVRWVMQPSVRPKPSTMGMPTDRYHLVMSWLIGAEPDTNMRTLPPRASRIFDSTTLSAMRRRNSSHFGTSLPARRSSVASMASAMLTLPSFALMPLPSNWA